MNTVEYARDNPFPDFFYTAKTRDEANQSTALPGDSGGPLLSASDGTTILGITSVYGCETTSFFGKLFPQFVDDQLYGISGYTRVDVYQQWIQAQITSCTGTVDCFDGIMNGDETGIDCGGSCGNCFPCSLLETCNDGLDNDCDGHIDCDDLGCMDSVSCCGQDGTECCPNGAACTSGLACDETNRCTPSRPSCMYGDGLYCGDSNLGQNENHLHRCIDGSYELQDDCGGNGCIVNPPGIDDACRPAPSPCGNGKCEVGIGESCQSCADDCCIATPNPLQPADSAKVDVDAGTIQFSWTEVPDGRRYRIKICSDALQTTCVTCLGSANGTCEFDQAVTSASVHNPGEGTWYWSVAAIPQDERWGWSRWSPPRTLTVAPGDTETCDDECTPGYKYCPTSTTRRYCGTSVDSDPCWELTAEQSCAPGLICMDGDCVEPDTGANECTTDSQCSPAEFCGSGRTCMPDACTQGAVRCNSGAVERCTANGSGWTVVQECPFGCTSGACDPECRDDSSCLASQYCSGGACVKDACMQGQTFCSGSGVAQCNDRGSGSSTIESCAFGCSGGACKPECHDDSGCAPTKHCTAGLCKQDECRQGQEFCSSTETLSLCDARGTTWTDVQTCPYGCDALAGACAPCPADCTDKCGGADDGCGGTCDSCAPNQVCQNQACVGDPCSPDPCSGHGTCSEGLCTCTPPFAGRYCTSCAPGHTDDYPTCTPLCKLEPEGDVPSGGLWSNADLAWNGSEYGFVHQWTRTTFRRLSADGSVVGTPVELGEASQSEYVGVAWSPTYSRFGVVWGTSRLAFFQCVSAAGVPEGPVIDLCGAGSSVCKGVSMTSDGIGHFGVVWSDDRTGDWRVYFNRINANSCQLSGPDTQVSSIWGSNPAVAFSSMQYAVAWVDSGSGLWATRLDHFGEKLADVHVAAGRYGGLRPSIAGMPSTAEWGIVWSDNPDNQTPVQLYFQRFHESGTLLGSPVQPTSAASTQRYAQITAASASYGVFWLDQETSKSRFQRFDRFGQPTSPALVVADNAVGTVAGEGASFMTVYHTGKSRKVVCE